jgi:hypothetical protein
MAAQTAIQTRARHIGVEKLARGRQQVVQRQQQHPAQLDCHTPRNALMAQAALTGDDAAFLSGGLIAG